MNVAAYDGGASKAQIVELETRIATLTQAVQQLIS